MNIEQGEPCVIKNSAQKLYPAETHCHTKETGPCGQLSAEYIVQAYLEEHYRYLFITDHMHETNFEKEEMKGKSWEVLTDRYLSGYRTAKKAAEGTDLIVMLGMEVTLKGKSPIDFLVFGEDEQFIYDHPYMYNTDYQGFYKFIKENGLLAFEAHPYRYGGEPVQPICYDGIEIFNAHPRHVSRNQRAVQYAKDKDLYVISGSDVHAKEDIARGGVMLPDGIESGADFVRYIKEHGSPELIISFQ